MAACVPLGDYHECSRKLVVSQQPSGWSACSGTTDGCLWYTTGASLISLGAEGSGHCMMAPGTPNSRSASDTPHLSANIPCRRSKTAGYWGVHLSPAATHTRLCKIQVLICDTALQGLHLHKVSFTSTPVVFIQVSVYNILRQHRQPGSLHGVPSETHRLVTPHHRVLEMMGGGRELARFTENIVILSGLG